jgi:AcrR family transcriptional regulator/DNA-binding MarR family transcriptional regulator
MLNSATLVVAREGFERMSIARVTGGARVSRRTFYDIFDDREDCFLALFEDALARVEGIVRDAYEGESGSWRDRVRAGLRALLTFLDERPEMRSVLVVDALVAGPRVLACRAQALGRAGDVLHRDATKGSARKSDLPGLTGEALVSAVFGLVHARCAEKAPGPLLPLLSELMGVIVLPYEGPAVARKEVRGSRTFSSGRREASSGLKSPTRLADFQVRDPLAGLPMRLTYRTVRVLSTIAEHLGASNREVGDLAGLSDQGQTSKLLQRLERLGLIHNSGLGHPRGETNAWHLTPRGEEVERAVRMPSGGDDDGNSRQVGARRRGSRR